MICPVQGAEVPEEHCFNCSTFDKSKTLIHFYGFGNPQKVGPNIAPSEAGCCYLLDYKNKQ